MYVILCVYRKVFPLLNAVCSAGWVQYTHHQLVLKANSYVCSNDEAEVSCDDQ